ncbi:putative rho1 guanine nucleotide exchange factor 3 [Cladorrhinum samala]|uniref:Rho1 guanine nucleotide exchange factor 3 n=1 Tax=Cladorrhinum samala TaxID=585594 RepID=A0AAV9HEI3_9PEZI|nr:putative rho1 guanine nucleotide exchange factor 3 [Cladorrhinum samala]
MSFRGDESRRYGHVPPAQYPVAGTPQQPAGYPQRRPSFNNGDDQTYFDQNAGAPRPQPLYTGNTGALRGEEELFISSPTNESHPPQNRPPYVQGLPASPAPGYQRQYQAQVPPPPPSHSTYNPQHFARSQSTSLPYHPSPGAARYTPTQSPTYQSPPTNYTPQAYNPAAYANASASAVPQRHSTVAGYSNYGYSYNSGSNPHVSAAYAPATPTTYGAPQQTLAAAPSPQPSSNYDHGSQYSSSAVAPANSQQYESSYSSTTAYSNTPQYSNSYAPNGSSATTSPAYSVSTSQAPYPTHSQIPVGPAYSPDPSSFASRTSRANSQTSPLPSPPSHSLQNSLLSRHPTNAPLPSRPMDYVPEETTNWRDDGRGDGDVLYTQDSLMQDIASGLGVSSHGQRPLAANGASDDALVRRYASTASNAPSEYTLVDRYPSNSGASVNRYLSNASTAVSNVNDVSATYNWDSEESDPEGAAGLLAMQDDLDDRRFGGGSYSGYPLDPSPLPLVAASSANQVPQLPSPPEEQVSTDSDYGGMDLGMYGGGYPGNLHYGNELGSPSVAASTFDTPRPLPIPQGQPAERPPFSDVSVDYGGTGGLQTPQQHRLSFDEGDERVDIHSPHSASDSPSKEDYPYDQMFWHPGLSNRPLPAIPPVAGATSKGALLSPDPTNRAAYQHNYSLSADDNQLPYPPDSHDGYHTQQHVERSISLSNHSNTPPIQAPARSRTDAAEERRRAQKHISLHQHHPSYSQDGYDPGTPPSLAGYDMITLPTGRRKKFTPSKLTAADIKRCVEPWALSGITAWIREMAEGEPDLKRKTIEEGVLKLFCAKVPTMNVADAELLSANVVDSMFAAGILIPEEEWVKFGPGQMSGVIWQLTGSGCYAPKLHEDEGLAPRLYDNGIPVRCYSHHCGRTLKKVNLDSMMSEEDDVMLDWATFHGVTKDDIQNKHKKEIERQNVLHEIVTGEEDFMNQLDVLRLLYRDQLRVYQPPIIATNRLDKFLDMVFGKVDSVQQINKEHLLSQLKYRQKEQGPWIVGFSDLFREWIRKAKPIYIAYCSSFPHATYLIRREASRNLLFRQFLDMVRDHPRSKRLEWTTFVKAPITRLQRYGLLLETVKKNMIEESEEKANLTKALEEIKAVTHECDEKVAEMTKKVELLELQSMLVLRPGFQSVLNLDHLGRELLKQGELQRQGSKGVRWVDTHALLFDHYFILAKAVAAKDGRGDKKYDVSKEPIPMPLLFLESLNDDPITKQKGLTAPLTRTAPAAGSSTQLSKVASNGDRPGIDHAGTSSSIGSANAVSRLGSGGTDDGKIIYPFRIKHLGHEIYTLYAPSAQDRATWCSAIIEAKTRHARALHAQNAEPFRLRIISDGAFAYDSTSPFGRQPSVSIRGTPLDRAIREMEQVYGPGRGPPPVCRATVNCACGFTAFGKSMIAIGTDYGVYISEASNPRGWIRSVQISRVTQIAVLEDFSVCLLIADRSLISYPLDVVAPISNFPAPTHDNPRRAPQRLAKDVAFFATAKMKDRMLLFYKRKEGMHNTFKVLEPVFQKATEKRSRLFGGRKGGSGSTESFRDFDEFYLPTECFSLNLFQNYIAVASAKGFELLTLDKKVTQSIPRDLSLPAIANIASRIEKQRPLGMFKLNDQEFLLTYEDCAVYVDKHGEISRTLIMEYSGKQKKAKAASMFGQYLLLFNEDYVEVRNAENGRLRQIIAGRDVRCLDYGFRGPTGSCGGGLQPPPDQDSKGTIKICMSHPEVAGGQIVLEMLLNDGHAEKST